MGSSLSVCGAFLNVGVRVAMHVRECESKHSHEDETILAHDGSGARHLSGSSAYGTRGGLTRRVSESACTRCVQWLTTTTTMIAAAATTHAATRVGARPCRVIIVVCPY